jgi:heme/copper-type cytochrome/quinol oxidase subunit 2
MLEEFNVLNFFIIFFGFFAIIVVITLVASVYLARAKNKTSNQDEKIVKEKEIIKEIVMVPCIYCGSLMPQTALFCNTCGAGRKA